jgi:predicted metalloenzyme YecM
MYTFLACKRCGTLCSCKTINGRTKNKCCKCGSSRLMLVDAQGKVIEMRYNGTTPRKK